MNEVKTRAKGRKKQGITLQRRLVVFVVLPVFLCFVFTFLYAVSAYHIIEEREIGQKRQAIGMSVEKTLVRFEELISYFETYFHQNTNYLNYIYARDESTSVANRRKIYQDFQAVSNTLLSSVMIFLPHEAEARNLILGSAEDYSLRSLLQEEILAKLRQDKIQQGRVLSFLQIKEQGFFALSFYDGTGCLCAVISLEQLLKELSIRNNGVSFSLSGEGEVFYSEGDFFTQGRQGTEHYVSSWELYGDKAELSVYIDRDVINQLIYPQFVTLFFVFVAFSTMLFCLFFFLKRYILNPIGAMKQFVRRIRTDPEERIALKGRSEDFNLLFRSFNHTLDILQKTEKRTEQLELEKSKAEYNFLRAQIKPHFFINLLNTLHSLIIVEENEVALKMVEYMSSYYRYILHHNSQEITLGEEIDGVRQYLAIQEIRYPGKLKAELEVPQKLQECRIPLLILLTFVENVMEHAYSGKEISILVRAEDQEGRLRITVEDNGPGFSGEELERLNREQEEEAEESIGIPNVRRRIKLLYGSKAFLSVQNADSGGAKIVIDLPAEEGE